MKPPSLFRSFAHALRGLRYAFHRERSFRVQLLAGIVVLFLMGVLPLTGWERVILLAIIMFVLVLELLNTSIEHMVDLVKPRLNEYVGEVKDLMAGAVLLASVFAVIIGAVIFWPHLAGSLGL